MSIFSEVKEYLTARQVAEYYGLQVKRNGLACCPFHDDKHPSMKIEKNYHCFACGVGGDVVDYVSRMFGLSQYDAALQLIEDFQLPISARGKAGFNEQEKARITKEKAEKERIIHILVSKKFALLKKPVNPSRFRTHPAVPELSALCIILAVFLKGGKNVSADSA